MALTSKTAQKGYIEFGCAAEFPSSLKFFVKDTAIGLSKENKFIIFDRFRQADESTSKQYGGTGLGLAITRNLIKLMKGDIWVEWEPGQGSSFYFTLPYKPYNDYELTR